jgi:hypothetical protein
VSEASDTHMSSVIGDIRVRTQSAYQHACRSFRQDQAVEAAVTCPDWTLLRTADLIVLPITSKVWAEQGISSVSLLHIPSGRGTTAGLAACAALQFKGSRTRVHLASQASHTHTTLRKLNHCRRQRQAVIRHKRKADSGVRALLFIL